MSTEISQIIPNCPESAGTPNFQRLWETLQTRPPLILWHSEVHTIIRTCDVTHATWLIHTFKHVTWLIKHDTLERQKHTPRLEQERKGDSCVHPPTILWIFVAVFRSVLQFVTVCCSVMRVWQRVDTKTRAWQKRLWCCLRLWCRLRLWCCILRASSQKYNCTCDMTQS